MVRGDIENLEALEGYVSVLRDNQPVGDGPDLDAEIEGPGGGPCSHMTAQNPPNIPTSREMVVWQMPTRVNTETPPLGGAGVIDPPDNESQSTPPPAFYKKREPVEVIHHRPIRKNRRREFAVTLALEIKAKLGTPKRTSANEAVVRHMAYSRCKEMNVRIVDTRSAVERASELVFANDEADVDSAKIRNSRAVAWQSARVAYQSKSSLYRFFISENIHCYWSRAPPSARDVA